MNNFCIEHPNTTYLVNYNEYTSDPTKLKGLFEFLGEEDYYNTHKIEELLSTKLNH